MAFVIMIVYTFQLTAFGFVLCFHFTSGQLTLLKLEVWMPGRCAVWFERDSIVLQLWGLVAVRHVWQELMWRMCADTCSCEAAQGHGAWQQCVCVCEGPACTAMPTVASHTTKLVLLSSFTGRSVNVMGSDNGDLIRGEVQRLKLPKEEFREQSRCVSRKNPSPLATLSVFTCVIYTLNNQRTMAVRLRPLSVVCKPLKRYTLGLTLPLCPPSSPAGRILENSVGFFF